MSYGLNLVWGGPVGDYSPGLVLVINPAMLQTCFENGQVFVQLAPGWGLARAKSAVQTFSDLMGLRFTIVQYNDIVI